MHVMVVFGTRPEAIKMAPVIAEFKRRANSVRCSVVVTAQHREMLDQVLSLFDVVPDVDLDIMTPGQSLSQIASRSLDGLSPVLSHMRPDVVLVQGDTTTTFAASLAAFYLHIPVGHVEAGLRTGDLQRPFPEEANRVLTTRLARWHFAPTSSAARNLSADGISDERIHVTGNTVIDALLSVRELAYEFCPGPTRSALRSDRRIVLVTAHRRENWGEPFGHICDSVRQIADTYADVAVLFAAHRNPVVANAAAAALADHPRIALLEPVEYLPFVKLMDASTLILSDSGGVQEEAPSLGKPVLVLRESTERQEAVEAGVVQLVGTDCGRIFKAASHLLDDANAYAAMAHRANPFGDGKAAARIADVLQAEATPS